MRLFNVGAEGVEVKRAVGNQQEAFLRGLTSNILICMNVRLGVAKTAAKVIGALPVLWRMELFRSAAGSLGLRSASFQGLGSVFEAPLYDRVGWIHYVQGIVNSGTCNVLQQLFKSGSGTLIDVGANIGLVCIPVKREIRGIDVFAIEADPENANCLRMNSIRAGISDLTILYVAAYRRETTLDFERSDENCGDHRIRAKNAPGKDLCNESSRPVIRVRAAPLDMLISRTGIKKPVVMKLDVQGAEADVLAGAKELLESVDVIVTEFWPYGLKRAGAEFDELMSIFSKFPYGTRFDVSDRVPAELAKIGELEPQLRNFYSREVGIAHWDVLLSRRPRLTHDAEKT